MDKHVALILGVGDLARQEIHLVNGGHYPPAILTHDGVSEFVEQRGKPVGLFDEVHYAPQRFQMTSGDKLVMFSDGVMDTMAGADLAAKEQRLLEAATRGGNVEEMWSLLDIDFNVGSRPDDMTCLLIQKES
jgi:serine phosphatase RsbU (regulator of sigma subunit)